MSNERTIEANPLEKIAESRAKRRGFLRNAALLGAGGLVLGASGLLPAAPAYAKTAALSDADVLNFALNLEYLEAEFYLRASSGYGLPANMVDGKGKVGQVFGGRKVNFETPLIRKYAYEIAGDERKHVDFLRTALGSARVSRPEIDLKESFTAAALAAGLIQPGERFDAFANENNFLLAAYIFEDVGVTAYKGAAPLISNKTFLEAAAGILAVEAYHAGNIRTALFARGLEAPELQLIEATLAISNARDSLDGPTNIDQGTAVVDGNGNIVTDRQGLPAINIVPTDEFGVAFSRSAGEVLNIVYLTPESATQGGFFPKGVHGKINTSDHNA